MKGMQRIAGLPENRSSKYPSRSSRLRSLLELTDSGKLFFSGISTVSAWTIDNTEGGGVFLAGKMPSFVHTVVVGALIWTKTILGEESEEWKRL